LFARELEFLANMYSGREHTFKIIEGGY